MLTPTRLGDPNAPRRKFPVRGARRRFSFGEDVPDLELFTTGPLAPGDAPDTDFLGSISDGTVPALLAQLQAPQLGFTPSEVSRGLKEALAARDAAELRAARSSRIEAERMGRQLAQSALIQLFPQAAARIISGVNTTNAARDQVQQLVQQQLSKVEAARERERQIGALRPAETRIQLEQLAQQVADRNIQRRQENELANLGFLQAAQKANLEQVRGVLGAIGGLAGEQSQRDFEREKARLDRESAERLARLRGDSTLDPGLRLLLTDVLIDARTAEDDARQAEAGLAAAQGAFASDKEAMDTARRTLDKTLNSEGDIGKISSEELSQIMTALDQGASDTSRRVARDLAAAMNRALTAREASRRSQLRKAAAIEAITGVRGFGDGAPVTKKATAGEATAGEAGAQRPDTLQSGAPQPVDENDALLARVRTAQDFIEALNSIPTFSGKAAFLRRGADRGYIERSQADSAISILREQMRSAALRERRAQRNNGN